MADIVMAQQELELEDLVADALISELSQKCCFLTFAWSVESLKKHLENRLGMKGLTAKNLDLVDIETAAMKVLNNFSQLCRIEPMIINTITFKIEGSVSTARVKLEFNKAKPLDLDP